MQLIETELIGARLLMVLKTLLQNRYPEVELADLGRRCGLGEQWWQPCEQDNLIHVLLLLEALRRNEVPSIALEMGDQAQLSDLGLLGYAMLTSPTVEQAANITCHALSEASYLIRAKVLPSDRHGLISFHVTPEALNIEQLILELCTVSAWRYIQGILPEGRSAAPDYVNLACAPPPYRARYEELLGCPVHFGEPDSVIAVPIAWVYRPILTGNEQLLTECSRQVQQILGEGYRGSSIIPRVKRMLVAHPQECAFKLENTAERLRLSPRSLRRYLEQAGSSFRRVCLEVRMELAREYLYNTRMTLKEIAYQLGYTHTNNFNRAFSDYYSMSPSAMRQAHQAASATDTAGDH